MANRNNNANDPNNVYTHPFTKNGRYTNVGLNMEDRNMQIRSHVKNLYNFANKRKASGANRLGVGMTRNGSPRSRYNSRKRKGVYERVCDAVGQCFTRKRRRQD